MCCIKKKTFFPNINYYIRKLFLLDYQIEDFTKDYSSTHTYSDHYWQYYTVWVSSGLMVYTVEYLKLISEVNQN